MKCQLATALFGLLPITAHAAPTEKQCATAGLFVAMTNLNLVTAGIEGADYTLAHRDEALGEFDSQKLPAIKAIAGAPAYQAALKGFTVAARDYLRNIGAEPGESRIVYQARTAALKSRLEQAQERVTLEGSSPAGADQERGMHAEARACRGPSVKAVRAIAGGIAAGRDINVHTGIPLPAIGGDLAACRVCQQPVWVAAPRCPHCGYDSEQAARDEARRARAAMIDRVARAARDGLSHLLARWRSQ